MYYLPLEIPFGPFPRGDSRIKYGHVVALPDRLKVVFGGRNKEAHSAEPVRARRSWPKNPFQRHHGISQPAQDVNAPTHRTVDLFPISVDKSERSEPVKLYTLRFDVPFGQEVKFCTECPEELHHAEPQSELVFWYRFIHLTGELHKVVPDSRPRLGRRSTW